MVTPTSRAILAAALPALLACGCSAFERDWKAAADPPAADAPAPPVTPLMEAVLGRWTGLWRSQVTGHYGELRCIVRALEDGRVEARYRAEYGWLFSFEFTLPMALEPAVEGKEGCRFSGSADLGVRAGGVHTFDGHADGKTFTATYHSKEDYGAYEMERPQAGE